MFMIRMTICTHQAASGVNRSKRPPSLSGSPSLPLSLPYSLSLSPSPSLFVFLENIRLKGKRKEKIISCTVRNVLANFAVCDV